MQVREKTFDIVSSDLVDFNLSFLTDDISQKNNQILNLKINNIFFQIKWDTINNVRLRGCYLNGVYLGYLSENCGITVKSKVFDLQGLEGNLTEFPSPIRIVASFIDPNIINFYSDDQNAIFLESKNNSGAISKGTLNNIKSSVITGENITLETKDCGFSRFVKIQSNVLSPQSFLYSFSKDGNVLDYQMQIQKQENSINSLTYDFILEENDYVNETQDIKFFSDNFWFNLEKEVQVWFFSTDGEAFHCFNEDVDGSKWILGDIIYQP